MKRIAIDNEWNYIDDIVHISDNIEEIHVDTRDFCILLKTENSEDLNKLKVFNLLCSNKVVEKFLINQNEILNFIKEIEVISGGKGEWRFLNFATIDDTMGWLKYIRMYRYNDEQFIVCNSQSKAIDWRSCTENTLEKEYLNFY